MVLEERAELEVVDVPDRRQGSFAPRHGVEHLFAASVCRYPQCRSISGAAD
jgi:hypothetical protein